MKPRSSSRVRCGTNVTLSGSDLQESYNLVVQRIYKAEMQRSHEIAQQIGRGEAAALAGR